jgi:hypothetical protein
MHDDSSTLEHLQILNGLLASRSLDKKLKPQLKERLENAASAEPAQKLTTRDRASAQPKGKKRRAVSKQRTVVDEGAVRKQHEDRFAKLPTSKAGKKEHRLVTDDYGDLEEDRSGDTRKLRAKIKSIEQGHSSKAERVGGDNDVPFQDRTRERRAAPPGEDDDEEARFSGASTKPSKKRKQAVAEDPGEEDEFYQEMVQLSKVKRAAKQQRAESMVIKVPAVPTAADGEKRGATWQMMKNKGLTAHKNKLNRSVVVSRLPFVCWVVTLFCAGTRVSRREWHTKRPKSGARARSEQCVRVKWTNTAVRCRASG